MDYLDDSYLLSDENKVCLKCKAEYPMVRVFVSVKDAKDALRDVIIWCARNKDKIENDLKFLSKRFICKSKSSHPPSHTSN